MADFIDDSGLEVLRKSAVPLTPGDKTAYRLRTSGEGTFSPTGLSERMRTTTMEVNDTATALPATALSNRNSLEIHNLSSTDKIYIGESNVTADRVIGTTSGKEVFPNEVSGQDITDDIILYGIAETGKTILIKVTEYA